MEVPKRPRLDDPAEFAIIKSIYFKEPFNNINEIDPLERLERQEQTHTINHAK